jgi:hypothetical protein
LKILGLVASDFGIYQCIGSNPAGNVQAAASLTILPTGTVKCPLCVNTNIRVLLGTNLADVVLFVSTQAFQNIFNTVFVFYYQICLSNCDKLEK